MAKKIQVINQEEMSTDEMDQVDFQRKLLELLTAIDWKLWELYKIEMERDARVKPDNTTTETTNTDFTKIRINEEDK